MKNLSKTKFYFGLQIDHIPNEYLIHKSTYKDMVLKHFHMDIAHYLNTLMVVRSLGVNNDHFCLQKYDEEILDPKISYLSAINILMYFANSTRSDTLFLIN